ncbi:MAG TPA: alpha-E domain-containing protein, partial [Nevskiaceae bacterium]|nr:alpha-E domain-containing protein [Nevskiaceae bacterium]
MLSRTADNLYWLGRYLQRAENTARILNVQALLLLDMPRNTEFGWGVLVDILSAHKLYREHYQDFSEENVVRFLLLDPRNPGSIASSLAAARNILRITRDRLPRELWERVNDLYLRLGESGERALGRARRQEFLTRVTDGALLVYGMLVSNMSHDIGFSFLRLGTNIEQADMTTRIIDVRSADLIRPKTGEDLLPFQNIQWMGVLRSLSAQQMYQR